jgi:hypothetical protein
VEGWQGGGAVSFVFVFLGVGPLKAGTCLGSERNCLMREIAKESGEIMAGGMRF